MRFIVYGLLKKRGCALLMDCHASAVSRNDRKNAASEKVDSRTDCRTIAIAWACDDNKELNKQKRILL